MTQLRLHVWALNLKLLVVDQEFTSPDHLDLKPINPEAGPWLDDGAVLPQNG